MIVKMPALPAMTNVTAAGGDSNFGVYNNSSFPTIRNSSITGTTNSIRNSTDPSSSAHVADTALGGAVDGTRFFCVGVYDTDFTPANGSCVTP